MSLRKKEGLGICHDGSHGVIHATPILFAVIFSVISATAANPSDGFNDDIDRTDPNFVTASLLVMSPGDELYSCEEYIAGRKEWT